MKLLISILTMFCICVNTAYAEVRNALVIGNGEYAEVGALDNPVNDARLMSNTLRSLGFDVIEVINASQIDMKRAVRDFGTRLNEAGREGVGLFYYAGHGVQVNGANYMVPIDARIDKAGDVDIEAVNANSVLSMMEYSNARLSFVILDACRNNPYSRGFRSATRGLAKMSAPTGSFIAYATSPGDVAVDGDGENSPYTASLVANMTEPGVPIEKMFRNVRNEVRSVTDNQQTPWESSSLIGDDFYFNTRVEVANTAEGQEIKITTEAVPKDPGKQTISTPATTVQPLVIRNDNNIELLFWDSVKDSNNPQMLNAYINKYPQGIFVELARLKITASGGNHTNTDNFSEPSSPKATDQVVQTGSSTVVQPALQADPQPLVVAKVASDTMLRDKLNECDAHIDAKRLTTGSGGNALDCYSTILEKNPGNPQALAGLATIEYNYALWASTSLDRGDLDRAARNIRKLRSVNENNPELVVLENRLDTLGVEQNMAAAASKAIQPAGVATNLPAKSVAVKEDAGATCDGYLAAGNLTGNGSSNAYSCYTEMLANDQPGAVAEKGLANVESALLNEFQYQINDKSLRMSLATMKEFKRAFPDSSHLQKMDYQYNELKMEMRW